MHHFGAEVRLAREAAGKSQAELGELVPCDKGTVSRIESGLTVPDEHFADVCSTVFRNPWFGRFWRDSQTWGHEVPGFLPFADYEGEALALWLFEHTYIPGLLQTEDYARAVLERHPHVTTDEVSERVAKRMKRQAVLNREACPLVWVLLDENVLRREVGNAKIMHDAVSQLAALAEKPRVTVQLLPGTGAHVGLQGSMAMAETAGTTVVNLDDFTDGRTTDSPIIVAHAAERFDTLRSDAYRRSESLVMIEESAERWTT
jgi:transcriptional regulator with XRE-family HTH domain